MPDHFRSQSDKSLLLAHVLLSLFGPVLIQKAAKWALLGPNASTLASQRNKSERDP